jgi:hypothetical protein
MAYKPKEKIRKEIEIEMNSISDKITQLEKLPDAKKHQVVSFVKSGIRIVGYCLLPFSLETAAIILILSEAVGIIEELV